MTITAPKSVMRKSVADIPVLTRIKNFIGDYGIIVIFAALFLALAVIAPNFLTVDNLVNVMRQSSIIGIVAIGMTFVMITAGIDLSVGSVVGLAGLTTAMIATTDSPWSLPLALLGGLLVGLIIGFLNGLAVVWLAIVPFLATLATMAVVRSSALVITNGEPTTGVNEALQWLGSGFIGPVPVPVLVFLIIALIADYTLSRTRFGRHVYAVGGNEESAQKVGISTRRVLLSVYMISGMLAALAGVVLTARLDGAAPLAGVGYELQAIAAVVIGGTSLFGGIGTIRGTVLGVLLVSIAMNGLNLMNVSSYYQQGIQGLILVLAVLLNRWKTD